MTEQARIESASWVFTRAMDVDRLQSGVRSVRTQDPSGSLPELAVKVLECRAAEGSPAACDIDEIVRAEWPVVSRNGSAVRVTLVRALDGGALTVVTRCDADDGCARRLGSRFLSAAGLRQHEASAAEPLDATVSLDPPPAAPAFPVDRHRPGGARPAMARIRWPFPGPGKFAEESPGPFLAAVAIVLGRYCATRQAGFAFADYRPESAGQAGDAVLSYAWSARATFGAIRQAARLHPGPPGDNAAARRSPPSAGQVRCQLDRLGAWSDGVAEYPAPLRWDGYDLVVRHVVGPGGGLWVEYATDVLAEATIQVFADRLLHAWTTLGPDQAVTSAAVLTGKEQAAVFRAWQGAQQPYPAARFIDQIIDDAATRNHGRVAVTGNGGELTYRRLAVVSNGLAHQLAAAGIGPGAIVGIAADRSVHAVVAMLGVLKAGAAYLPLDVTYPPQRLQFIAGDAGLTTVAGSRDALDALAGAGLTLTGTEIDAEAALARSAPPAVARHRRDLAYVIYTSGSTGTPKGVAVEHRSLVCSNHARDVFGRPPVRDLLTPPLSFDASASGLFWTLTSGGTLMIANEQEVVDPLLLVTAIRERRVTHVHTAPSVYALIAEVSCERDMVSLEYVSVGGEPLTARAVRRHFAVAPDALLINDYGPTEGTVWCTAHQCGEADALGRSVPIGRPVPNYRVYLLDARGELVPPGLPGELCIGGPGVARGYLGRPGLTAARFVPDPFSGVPGARLYRTGDRARHRGDGSIEFLGRADDQVKIRGFRVEMGDIEDALRAHPAVADAAVLAVPAAAGDTRLAAYIVTTQDVPTDALRGYLSGKLPGYMVPGEYARLEELPRTRNGKIDRKRLGHSAAEPGPRRPSLDDLSPEQISALLRQLTNESARRGQK